MEKAYEKIVFVNDQAPDLDADNLNSISDAIDTIDDRVVEQDALIDGLDTRVSTNTTNISTNTADIAELKTKVGGIDLTSASPLNASTASSIVGIDVDGCSTQAISPNLLFTDASTSTQSGITFTKQSDGTWLINGTYTTNTFFNLNTELFVLDANTTYTMSGALNNACRLRIRGWDDTSFTTQILEEKYDVGSGVTFTTPNQRCYCRVQIVVYASRSNDVVKPMLVKGSSASAYQKYTGTPTPTNPIAIVDASGEVVAHTPNIIEGTDDWSGTWVGADKWNTNGTYLGLTVKKGTVTWNGLHKKFDAVSGKTYTISAYVKGSTSSTNLVCYTTTSALVGSKTIGTEWQRVSMSYTATASGEFGLRFESSNDANLSICGYMISTDGSDTYAPYASNKITLPTLRSVGTVKDELIVNADGSGQIIKRIGVENLKASSGWKQGGGNANKFWHPFSQAKASGAIMCNCFTKGAETVSNTCGIDTASNIWVNDADVNTLANWNTWIASNDLIVYYELATPTTTTLTASEVSAIRALQTYSGTTIIDSALDVQSVTYHAGVKEYIDWRFEQLATLMLGEE